MRRFAFVGMLIAGWVLARPDAVRFLRCPEVQPLLAGFAASPDKVPDFKDTEECDAWLRERDAAIRARIDRGIEDSVSALILFGNSFSAPPKLSGTDSAANAAGDLTASARARVNAFIQALDRMDNERFGLVIEYLRHRRVTEEELTAFLSGNLRRFALEQGALQKRHSRAEVGGVTADASLLINFAIEDTLHALKANGALPARIRRIAVIGPGLDFSGEPDLYPPQSVQPFAVLEAVLRLDLAPPPEVQITAMDINSFVLSHLRTSLGKIRAGKRYVLQLPHPSLAGWNAAAVSYWRRFGETIGDPATPLAAASGVELRAVAVKPQIAARITVEDLDIVTQTLDTNPGPGFDLVVATNVFTYYNRVEQALALTSIARMLASGGILISNGLSPSVKLQELEDLGARHVAYLDSGAGDDLAAHKRR